VKGGNQPKGCAIYQLALAVQLRCAKLLSRRERIITRSERSPSDSLGRPIIMGDGAHIDDAHSSGRCLLCGRRENREEQLGEIKVTWNVHVSGHYADV